MQKNPGCGEVGAFPGSGGSPSSGGSPQSRMSKLQVAAGDGKGRAGARRGGGRDKPSSEALDLGGKGGKRGIWGRFWIGFVFGLPWWGSGQGILLPSCPQKGRGDLGWGRWQGKPGTERGRSLIEGVISTQSPIAAPHPLGRCFKGKRGPGSVTVTRVGATGATPSPWPPSPGLAQCSSTSPRDEGGTKIPPWPPSPGPGQ